MEDKLTKKLFKQFKFLNKKEMENKIDCNNGWFDLLNNLFLELQMIKPDNFNIIKIYSVAEELKIYTKNGNNTTRMIIENSVEKSLEVCQYCGCEKEFGNCEKCKDSYVKEE